VLGLSILLNVALFPQQEPESWVDVLPGTMPLVLSAPHGGWEKPVAIADRQKGVLKRDSNTRELTLELADAIELRTGHRPFVVMSRLHRIKLDPNRPIEEAAQGEPLAESAWLQYHAALEHCSASALEIGRGNALLLDMHGHAHGQDWIELGYGVVATELAKKDTELADATWLRGPKSLGAFLTEVEISAVPSPAIPHPNGEKYFSGGYITKRHRSEGLRSIQLELPWSIRNAKNRPTSVPKMATAISSFFAEHFSIPSVPLTITREFSPKQRITAFEDSFAAYGMVFGIPVLATKSLAVDRHLHGMTVLAEYLDNDEDGLVDDPAVLKVLQEQGAFLVMPAREREMNKLSRHFEDWEQAGWQLGQDLYGEETNPKYAFDAALEEVWHLVSHGWAEAYPAFFAFESGSKLCDAMDVARRDGGHYHYVDPTCDYPCQAAEYSYWVLTSLLGAQMEEGRARWIADEWECPTPQSLKQRDPLAYELFTDPTFVLPRVLPDGKYREE